MPRGRRREAEFSSYHDRPIIKVPVWEERDIGGYLFLGGLAGSSSLIAAGASVTGRPALTRVTRAGGAGAIALSLLALIHDLGRPERFLHMLRVVKPSSPMSIGTWILIGYAPLTFAALASEIAPALIPRSVGRTAGLAAGALGPAVASYTAALICDTAVPAWHEGHREMPFLFVGSATSAGAGLGLIGAPVSETAPVRRLAVLGAAVELVAERLMERRIGIVAETYERGSAGRKLRLAKALTVLGGVGAGLAGVADRSGRRSRAAAAAAGAALVVGSLLTRLAVFEAGIASAEDPKYTVVPQRERLANRAPATSTR